MYYSLTLLSLMSLERLDDEITMIAGKLSELRREKFRRVERVRVKAIIDCSECLENGITLCPAHATPILTGRE